MQRYGVPWDYMDREWTQSQWFAIYSVIASEGKKRGRNAAEYRGYG